MKKDFFKNFALNITKRKNRKMKIIAPSIYPSKKYIYLPPNIDPSAELIVTDLCPDTVDINILEQITGKKIKVIRADS